ncbi:unnamed protein product (macronuclear) [Paramecium tetraurelia]|uniref:G domain-containing protein n=1 Tax=Paramecium tetraurelia TaxID=5888 RepID=A0BYS7_PARTE|nr:uncharacterized protein GSPATT00033547001 [Paramecium tetraurelia]CAK63694.1 unnamed protein product [Paramecium tetraurelia]|eukprot:XP_001431092.1 hypothetical protein (macronuclear) [Paramecium tetraurelia strain d4-2]
MDKKHKRVVLIGFIGCGKTTLFNKICNTDFKVKQGGQSDTRQVFLKESCHGQGFRVLDTPGFGSSIKKIEHAVGVLNALTEGPLNQIFLVVKWERLGLMRKYIKDMVLIFMRYRNLVTIAVTHMDIAEKNTLEKDKLEFANAMKSFGLYSIVYFSIHDSKKQICFDIDKIILRTEQQKVDLTETEFYTHFDLIEYMEELEMNLEVAKGQIVANFNKISKVVVKFIQEFDVNDKKISTVMHYLALEVKRLAEKEISEFERKNNDIFSQLYEQCSDPVIAYLVDFALKKELMDQVDNIVKLTQLKILNDQEHFFHYIKACPNCGLIWLKVSGCEGATNCGNFPDVDEYFNSYKETQKYKFDITEKGVKFQEMPNINNQEVSLKTQSTELLSKENNQSQKRQGCKAPIE